MGSVTNGNSYRMPASFYWYDLETSGTHPASDRIVQFAGCRTDTELNVVDDPYVTYVKLAPDILPSPEACLVTGITPQRANAEGVDEWEALHRIDALMRQPGTCVVGYNNLRFDDEFLRYGLYRNLMDPYAREWQEGNSRWDLIDLVRATCALRPDGISWPEDEGVVSFGLEKLCAENGISHDHAHDALADVNATIGLARKIRAAQPRLWDFAVSRRFKSSAGAMLQPLGQRLCVHVSSRFPNERFCAAPVASVAVHPDIDTRMIVADLSRDIAPLIELGASEIAERLFAQEVPEGEERPPLKVVVMNRCPFLAPINVVGKAEARRLRFDLEEVEHRRGVLAARQPGLADKIAEVYRRDEDRAPAEDAELALYDDFFKDPDRLAMKRLDRTLAEGRPWPDIRPRDERLVVLALRLKARERDEQLEPSERDRWLAHVRHCLDQGFGRRPALADYRQQVAELLDGETDPARRELLQELADFVPVA